MGGICSAGGSYSPPGSPASSPVHHLSARTSQGEELTHVRQLASPERERFLQHHDPLRSIPGLDHDALVYRTTPRKFVKNGTLAGNPDSIARIALHDELRPNHAARQYCRDEVARDRSMAYLPRQIRAKELGMPSLNVMYGSAARDAVQGYAQSSNHVTVQMRLGDFLDRGGEVYKDVSAVAADDETAHALIVTVPKGARIPARTLD